MIKTLVAVLGSTSVSGCKLLNQTTSSARQIGIVSKQRRPFRKLLILVVCLAAMATISARG